MTALDLAAVAASPHFREHADLSALAAFEPPAHEPVELARIAEDETATLNDRSPRARCSGWPVTRA
jgi:hypothetical protein